MATDFDKSLDKFVQDVTKFTDLRRLKKRDIQDLMTDFVGKIKEEIGRGLSPLTRKRFPAYKNPEKYPGRRKPHAPVNLELTGDMLGDLSFKVAGAIAKKEVDVDFSYSTSKSRDKEEGHRKGVRGQPKRPSLPIGKENFSTFLIKELEARFAALVNIFDL